MGKGERRWPGEPRFEAFPATPLSPLNPFLSLQSQEVQAAGFKPLVWEAHTGAPLIPANCRTAASQRLACRLELQSSKVP